MKKRNEDNPENQGGLGDMLPADVLKLLNELLERMHRAENNKQGSKIEVVYVASGGQHVETQINIGTSPNPSLTPDPSPLRATLLPSGGRKGEGSFKGREKEHKQTSGDLAKCIKLCITLLMQEKYGEEPLFNQQNHWQAVYRILVDKGYCRDSDFDGFDTFIRMVMPEEVNKPYSKGSVKQISQTDFVRPFEEWKYDALTSKTRKPFERMVAVASRFKSIIEENGL